MINWNMWMRWSWRDLRERWSAVTRTPLAGRIRTVYSCQSLGSLSSYNAQSPPEGLPAAPRFRVQTYQIPLRSLIAADVDNLLMVGRCISGDVYALGSYRLTGNVVRTGEAAGVAAAMAVENGMQPPDLPGQTVVERLNRMRTGQIS